MSASEELRRLDEEKNLDAFLRALPALIEVVEAAERRTCFAMSDEEQEADIYQTVLALAALSRVLEGEEA